VPESAAPISPLAALPVTVAPGTLALGPRRFDITHRAVVMGILNRTPDSFYDKGSYYAFDDFLRKAVEVVRARFGGKVSYASLPLEGVDWTAFDIISTDAAYRTKATAPHFSDNIRAFVAQGRAKGKPVAITEFGCTTHRGAADGGGDSLVEGAIVVWGDDGRPIRLNGDYIRDEDEQATYLREVLAVFEAEGVDSAFVNTFVRYDLPHKSDPREDFDMASFGVVKVLDGDGVTPGRRYPGVPWEPKASFDALADCYRR